MEIQPCKVCDNINGNELYQLKEMQLGLREMFTYMRCAKCGCMQLLDIPADLGKYYSNENYYSFNLGLNIKKKPGVLRKIKADYLLYGKQKILGGLLSLGYKAPDYYSWLKNSGVQYEDAILDAGTGNGSLLMSLYRIGFTNLTGIDPFIDKEQHYGSVNIFRKNIFETTGQFDLIMLHHAFEHMDEPLKVLLQLNQLLKKGKCLLIRTPVMGMYSWKTYKENWMDLDAPRHIIIHTIESMKLLAEQSGFKIKKIVFDSNYMSLIGSDQYAKGIALPDPQSYSVNKEAAGYSKEEIETFKATAAKIDKEQQGDQAAFYLWKE
ncbi:MAG: class I SAM-dependent methyltransferase [Ferruginibacter sp.]